MMAGWYDGWLYHANVSTGVENGNSISLKITSQDVKILRVVRS